MVNEASGLMITEEQYQQYKNMIWKQALSFNKTTGVPIEELVSEGNVAFCRAIGIFDPDRGVGFGTYFWLVLETQLKSFVRKWRLWSAVSRTTTRQDVAVKLEKKGRKGRTVLWTTVRTEDIIYLDSDSMETDGMKSGYIADTWRRVCYENWLQNLSEDAREIVNLVTSFDAQDLCVTGASTPLQIQRAIRNKLALMGWNSARRKTALGEVIRKVMEL